MTLNCYKFKERYLRLNTLGDFRIDSILILEPLAATVSRLKPPCGAVAQWLALVTRDRKVASSIPGRGIPRNNLG